MGRKLTTGRYDTRQELEDIVVWFYKNSPNSMSAIADMVRVSQGTVSRIIDAHFRRHT